MNSPRERFQEDASAIRVVQDFADNRAIIFSIDMARLQLVERYATDASPAAALKLQGIQEFIDTWLTIGNKAKPAARPSSDQLEDESIPPLKPRK